MCFFFLTATYYYLCDIKIEVMAIKAYYTANQIVQEALYAVDDVDNRHYNKAVMYFMQVFRDFNLFHNEAVQERWIDVTAAKTVNLPEDMIRLLWVGVSINGELFSFTKSNKIISPTSAPLDDELDADRGETEGIVRSPVSGYGTKGSNVEYYYTVDMAKRRIVLKRPAIESLRFADRTEVLVGYVGHNVTDMDKTLIYSDAANMLINYVVWKLMADKYKTVPQWVVQSKKQDYEEARNMYDCLNLPDIDQLFDCIYETSGQNVRI